VRSRSLLSATFAVALLGVGTSAPPAGADEIDQQRQRVTELADRLEALENELGELDEQYGGTLDRVDELDGEIATSQFRVDEQSLQLAAVRGQLEKIAVARFTSGGASGLTPLFATPGASTAELQRAELTRVALDQGAGTADELDALVTDLAEATAELEEKKSQQAELLSSLEEQRRRGEDLSVRYAQEYAAAEAELGVLIAEEQERRAAAAIAEAQARELERQQARAAANARVAAPARGGGVAVPPTAAPSPPRPAASPTPATPAAPGNPAPTPSTSSPAPLQSSQPTAPAPGPGPEPTPEPAPQPEPEPAPVGDVPPPSSKSGIAVNAASGQLGVPYRFAAEAPGEAFDCSGLTKYAWGRAGVYLPHQSSQQYASTPHIPQDQVQPGDLIFYYAPIGHVGIYIGGGSLIHAPASGDVVKVSKVSWAKVVGVSRPG